MRAVPVVHVEDAGDGRMVEMVGRRASGTGPSRKARAEPMRRPKEARLPSQSRPSDTADSPYSKHTTEFSVARVPGVYLDVIAFG